MEETDHNSQPMDEMLLRVAAKIIAEEGEENLTMDRLAKESGVSRTTLYRSMGSRKDMLQRLSSQAGMQIAELDLNPDIRTRILDATHTVLMSTGSTHFTLEQVATEAGLGIATVYRHFKTKENLLQNLASTFYHPRRAARELLSHATENIQADLEEFVTHVVQFMQSQGEIPRMVFSGDARMKELFQANRSDQERTLTSLTRYLSEQIKAGRLREQDPMDLSTAFFGMIIGFAFLKPTYTQTMDSPERIAKLIVQIFLTGAGNR